ncbi:MAG: type VI secretion system baseplate subunit TssG [Rhizobacter sp.]|nr:type VI secretion system baseplate subunit TssG [Rhizobacter sp.]
MPAPQRLRPAGVIEHLLEEPHRFEFFQAVRLLERWLAGASPRASGELLPLQLRFLNSTSLSFPASDIESLRVTRRERQCDALDDPLDHDDDRPSIEQIAITPAFMGLLGVGGTLPLIYTEQIAQREFHHKDTSARSFFDLFSHRAVALFYAAWKKSRLHLQYEADRRNRFAPMVLALAGVGQASLNDRLQGAHGGVNDETLAFFAGTLQQRTLSAKQLTQLLSRYLHVPVQLEQFCGRWYTLPSAARLSLGLGNGVLGRNALAGERVWQRDLRVALTLGPLKRDEFRRFLPGAAGATALRELLTLLNGVSLEFEVRLMLRAEAAEGSALDSQRSPDLGRLGWDTYMQTRPQTLDRCDVRYDVHAAA